MNYLKKIESRVLMIKFEYNKVSTAPRTVATSPHSSRGTTLSSRPNNPSGTPTYQIIG